MTPTERAQAARLRSEQLAQRLRFYGEQWAELHEANAG
jgi:hypothetical protein